MQMDERKQKVLQAIIQDYIATAEPIGSRTISRKYKLGVSAATIRNEMADLEDMGYIEQPYTSAGRIPSDKGYRYYVDYLMKKDELSDEEERFIHNRYKDKLFDLEEVIRGTGNLLSNLTEYTSIILGPEYKQGSIHHVELTGVGKGRALLIIVTDTGIVEHKLLDIPESITREDLAVISRVLLDKLHGLTLEKVSRTVLSEIYTELHIRRRFIDLILDLIEDVLSSDEDDIKIYLNGTVNILKQPEFKDVDKLHSLLSLLEKQDILKEIVNPSSSEDLIVKIGEENTHEGIKDCSLIIATYTLENQVIGSVGVLGPRRMKYSSAVTKVEAITDTLSDALSKYYKWR